MSGAGKWINCAKDRRLGRLRLILDQVWLILGPLRPNFSLVQVKWSLLSPYSLLVPPFISLLRLGLLPVRLRGRLLPARGCLV